MPNNGHSLSQIIASFFEGNGPAILNGKEVLTSTAVLDVNRHQMAFAGDGGVKGKLLPARVEAAVVEIDGAVRFQQMLGWGGTATPPAFAELSAEGKSEWWRLLAEYNLLLHRCQL